MNAFRQIREVTSRWIDAVTATLMALYGQLAARRTVRLVEREPGSFAFQSESGAPVLPKGTFRIEDGAVRPASPALTAALQGMRVEVLLDPGRFLFKSLELPKRAAEFLSGVVRSQIDRLTPWNPADSAFGWSAPAEAGPDRIAVTVAATGRALVEPFVRALADLGASSIVLTATPPGAAAPVPVLEHNARNGHQHQRVRRVLALVLTVAVVGGVAAVAVDMVASRGIDAAQRDVARRIADRRAALLAAREGGISDPETAARRALERRKAEAPFSVLVIETLSQALPDHTYVTELRIEGDQLRVVGVTRDAPSLIRLIEQTGRFTRATFFAPTTRAPAEPGERFHIEARIEPPLAPRS
jgi:general secretion pathway protein L